MADVTLIINDDDKKLEDIIAEHIRHNKDFKFLVGTSYFPGIRAQEAQRDKLRKVMTGYKRH